MSVQETRQQILRAALKLFSERGFMGATTREIADEAGVAEVTLFRHFLSKDYLFEETLKGYSFLPELQEVLAKIQGMDYEEGMNVIALSFFEALKKRRDIIRIIQSEVYRYPEKIHLAYHEMIDGLIKALSGHLRGLQKKGLLRDFDPYNGARAFMGMIFSLFNMQEILLRSKYRKEDENTLIAAFVNIFIRGTIA